MTTEFVLRWGARVWGVLSTLLLVAFAFGGGENLHFKAIEAVGFLFFPVGVIIGFVVAWRRELTGGLITVGSLALFFVWLSATGGKLAAGPYFLAFAAPGFLHVAAALLSRRRFTNGVGSLVRNGSE